MPGVPSGRGCNACRQSKKKCDQQKPACSRCLRLHITCVGGGQRRFKFVDGAPSGKTGSNSSASSETSRSATPGELVRRKSSSSSMLLIPSNETTQLLEALTFAINPSVHDERFNLISSYGPFLNYIPARLGRNKALDAAVAVMTEAHGGLCRRDGGPTTVALTRYSHALSQLRLALDDPLVACSTETLCATMILCMCQMFLGAHGGKSHVQGMSLIMKHRGSLFTNTGDDFEKCLQDTMRGPVIFESFWRDDKLFTDTEWHAIASLYQTPSYGPETRWLLCAARIPVFIRRGQRMKRHNHEDLTLRMDVAACYESMRITRDHIKALQLSNQANFTSGGVGYEQFFMLHLLIIRLYAITISVSDVLGTLLSVLDPPYPNLAVDLHDDAVEIIGFAREMAQYRPVGASFISLCLCASWAATGEGQLREEIEGLIEEYASDYPGHVGIGQTDCLDMSRRMEERLKLWG